jgi:hypothetical protein
MKQLLQTLTPAESLLLRKGDITPKSEMLKVTLLDLLLKKVLVITTTERQSNSRDPVRTLQYVSTGENFRSYQALPHEMAYLTDFEQSRDLRMSFKDCVKVAFQNSNSEKKMRKTVRSTPALEGVFEDTWLGRLTGVFDYSERGFVKRLQLDKEIQHYEEKIPKLLQTNREEAMEELRKIGGNIFLLHHLGITMLKEIEEAFLKHIPVQSESSGGGGGCATFISYSNDFDSSCPSDSDSGGGCSSGDGGCSSGCGGCGGGD